MFDPVDASLSSFTELVPIGTDLTFSTHAFAVRTKINVQQLPQGWMLKAVRQSGIDVTDSGVDLALGADVRDIEVEITDRLTEITGVVRGANGDLVDDYTVIIFAKDPTRRTGNPRYFASARPDQNRSFSIRGLAPGDYLAVALEYANLNIVEDPAFLETVAKGAASLTLRDAEARTLQLTLLP